VEKVVQKRPSLWVDESAHVALGAYFVGDMKIGGGCGDLRRHQLRMSKGFETTRYGCHFMEGHIGVRFLLVERTSSVVTRYWTTRNSTWKLCPSSPKLRERLMLREPQRNAVKDISMEHARSVA